MGTPLSWAAVNGHLDMVKFLVKEASTDVESTDELGNTPLDLARNEESWNAVRWGAVAAWLEERERGGGEDGT